MDPTTLVTFLYRAPAEARTVELLGSWDNFEQPYRMHNDRRRGIWSGIFKFENISFDGEGRQWSPNPRSGGLRQGATYWYYYRLNSYEDTFDDRQPRTTSCPFLPGQAVNIIEVPIELVELPTRCCSASSIEGSLQNWQQQQSLDPANKYAMLEPPPASKTHNRCLSDGTLNGRLENPPLSIVVETVSIPSTPCFDFERPTSARRDSRNGASCSSSVYSRDTTGSAAVSSLSVHTHEKTGDGFHGFPHSNAMEPALSPLSEAVEVASVSSVDSLEASRPVSIDINNEHVSGNLEEGICQENQRPELLATPPFPARKVSALSLGPISVQNVQFYNESRPGTSLNEDPEQHRPRVYSLPNSEVRKSEEGSPQVSPLSTAYHLPEAIQNEEESATPDSDLPEFDLGSPSFSAGSITSDGEDSPFHLSPQNSLKRNRRPASRSGGGGALSEFANRIRSIRTRNNNPPRIQPYQEAETASSKLSPSSFMNYVLPNLAVGSDISLTKTMSTLSAPQRSGHEHQPLPTVFNDELPSIFTGAEEHSMADAIFSELGYLSASIG